MDSRLRGNDGGWEGTAEDGGWEGTCEDGGSREGLSNIAEMVDILEPLTGR